MSNTTKNSNNSSRKKRRNNVRTSKKDELMDQVDKAFENSPKKNGSSRNRRGNNRRPNNSKSTPSKESLSKNADKFSIVEDGYFNQETEFEKTTKNMEFFQAHDENTFNEDEEKYFAEMERVYGSKLRKEEPVIPSPVIEEDNAYSHSENMNTSVEEDAAVSPTEEPARRNPNDYFAEMERVYGSRLPKEEEPIPSDENVLPKEVEEETVEEVKEEPSEDEVVEDTPGVVEEEEKDIDMSSKEKENDIDTFDTEIMSKIGEDLEEEIKAYQYGTSVKESHTSHKKHKPNIVLVIASIITFVCAIIYFVSTLINSSSSILTIIGSSVLMLFTILFMVICVTSRRKNILPMFASCVLLLAFFAINLFNPVETVSIAGNKVQNFNGKTLTDVVKWANDNKIKITQEYEFSDMVPEYEIISQNVKPGTSVSDIDEIVVSVSEGPNPYKEIIVPSMLTWDSERVVNYILTNHLSNVIVEFVDSDQLKDTVIEQSRSGNLKRNDELKLVFSYGDEGNSSEVTLVDFTKMTQFEIEFYMKQHRLNYNLVYDFSDKAKKGYGMKQSVAAGTVVRVQDDRVQVTISKGPKIEIPDLSGKTVNEITEWAISKKLKLEFVDQYDDSIKYGEVIRVDQEKGAVVEQGTVLKVTLSLGGLKMPKFKNVDAFYAWADKYGIKYETKHEFSESVEVGEVIEYSHKVGETIKNNEAITVTLSDGKKVSVPNLKGLTKSEAIKKLKAAKLSYNFVYRNNDATKDTVLFQSISAGSEVTSETTITVTLSSGKSSSENNNSSGGESQQNVEPTPAKTCTACTSVPRLTKVWNEIDEKDRSYQTIANALIAEIEKDCPGIDVQVRPDSTSGEPSGSFISGYNGGPNDENGNPLTSCSTVHITLAK